MANYDSVLAFNWNHKHRLFLHTHTHTQTPRLTLVYKINVLHKLNMNKNTRKEHITTAGEDNHNYLNPFRGIPRNPFASLPNLLEINLENVHKFRRLCVVLTMERVTSADNVAISNALVRGQAADPDRDSATTCTRPVTVNKHGSQCSVSGEIPLQALYQ